MLLYYISLLFLFIALLSSFALYFQPGSDIYLRLFPIFLCIFLIAGTVATYLSYHGKSNLTLMNGLSILTFCFYFFSLYRIIRSPKIKRVILHLIWVYPLLAFINILFIQRHAAFHTMTYSLGCLLVVAICVFYFLELFQTPNSGSLLRQPAFWICSGLLFYYSCSFPIYGFNSLLLRNASQRAIATLTIILYLLDVLLYSSFTIAFLCRVKVRKSTL